jgi:hypothetical protein
MKLRLPLCAALLAVPLAFLQVQAAQALDCPAGGAVAGDPAQAAAISATLGGGAAFEDLGWLNTSVGDLIGRGIPRTVIIDDMIGAYCRQVSAEAGSSEAAQTAKIRTFAARITQIAYAGGGGDEIILNVPFSAATIEKIDDQARAAGVSAEAWVAEAVEDSLD